MRPVLERAVKAEWDTICARLEEVLLVLDNRLDCAPPLVAQQLLVSGEDHRHGHHVGFDLIAIGRAIWRRLSQGIHEGGSTIEQQVVRVLTGRYERTIFRKVREIALATLVAQRYGKPRLPAVYLWIGYYGWRMDGYLEACRTLNLSPDRLSRRDAARLVARLKYPQPKIGSAARANQIERRAQHLCALYGKHVSRGIYDHLHIDGQTIFKRSPSREPIPQP